MSIIGPQTASFGDETGADGRCPTDTDLNNISRGASRRAWEVPGYAHLLGHDEIGSSGMTDYSDVFAGTDSRLLNHGVFTIGRGLEVSSSGLDTSVWAGFLGVWRDPDGPAPPPSSGDNRMYWVSVGDGDIAVTHTPAASGKTRWDLVCVTPSEVNGDSATRHFQDAVTGDISSQTVVVGRKPTITVSVVSGDEDTTANMPYLADLDDEHVVYAVLVNDSAIVSVWDFTVPMGGVKDAVTLGCEGVPHGSEIVSPGWEVAQNQLSIKSVASAAGELLLFPPAHVRGSSSSLLLGVKIHHYLQAGSTVKFASYPTATGGSLSNIVDVSSRVTRDGTDRTKMLDMRGIPASENMQPLWLNGTGKKGSADSELCLRVSTGGSESVSYIYNVRWFYL